MKIYGIAAFLLMLNLSIALIGGMGVLNAKIATADITEDAFKSEIPDEITYSDADIGLYLFGDFPRALGMLAKLFIYAPILLTLLLTEVGFSASIVNFLGVLTWLVYLVGIAQIVGKIDISGGA